MSHAIDISDDPRIEKDREALHEAVAEAGLLAYGVLLVEVWVFDSTHLHRAAHWLDPIFHKQEDHEEGFACPLCRLTEPTRPDFVAPASLAPGEGLPGVLWRDTAMMATTYHSARSATSHTNRRSQLEPTFARKKIAWRQVEAVANDPDQPWNPRLQVLKECGLGWAAAVSFSQGIVMYMARDSVDIARLKDVTNEDYLVASTNLIGALYSVQQPRQAAMAARRAEVLSGFQTVKNRLQLLVRQSKADITTIMSQSQEPTRLKEKAASKCAPMHCGTEAVTGKVKAAVTKMSGANVQPPPPMSWQESVFTTLSAGITLYAVTQVSQHLENTYGKEYQIILGPFGALMTLLYGLGAAPASQPRNIVLGQLVSLSIAIGIGSIDALTIAAKQSLAVALSIGVMVRLGLTHPPAGAAALLFAPGLFGWSHLLSMLIGNLVAIGLATVFNNWSSKRQYPSYWSFVEIPESFRKSRTDTS